MPQRDQERIHRRLAAEAAGATLPPLLVAAERVAATVAQGVHGRRRVGTGEAFWQFRRYRSGDPAWRIDWRRSARSQTRFVREQEWEAAESVWLWRDTSASMQASDDGRPSKLDRSELIVLALAALLVRGGERIALLGRDAVPRHGRHALNRMAHDLVAPDPVPDGHAATHAADTAGLPPFVPLPRDCRLVLVGDFLAPLPALEERVEAFAAAGVRGHLVQVLDPDEVELPFTGRVLFEDPETGAVMLADRVEAMREAYFDRLAAHRAGLADLTRRLGWTCAFHRTDAPPHSALLALYLALSAQRRW